MEILPYYTNTYIQLSLQPSNIMGNLLFNYFVTEICSAPLVVIREIMLHNVLILYIFDKRMVCLKNARKICTLYIRTTFVGGGECVIGHNTRRPQERQKYDKQLDGTSLVGIFRASFPNDYHGIVRKLESLNLYVIQT